MKPIHLFVVLPFLFSHFSCSSNDEAISEMEPVADDVYFPPINTDDWDTLSPEGLNWNIDKIESLLNYLEENNSKSFIVLYKGRIVIEEYFNGHDPSKLWYWASAGKTLTTAVVGIAQSEGLLELDDPVSDYLGSGWTSAPQNKEQQITIKNLLSMDSGLDDSNGDGIAPDDLLYKADAGTRWAYHNVYVKLQDVVSAATGQAWNSYFEEKLKAPIGIKGNYVNLTNFNVYWSNSRSMARFGLLISQGGMWQADQILPKDYLQEATTTSQLINQAYGYLWWLNGKPSYQLPQSQVKFQGYLIPNAPDDLYTALGKNDQKIYVVPSRDLVIIRMGEAADTENFVLSNFDNELWSLIMDVLN